MIDSVNDLLQLGNMTALSSCQANWMSSMNNFGWVCDGRIRMMGGGHRTTGRHIWKMKKTGGSEVPQGGLNNRLPLYSSHPMADTSMITSLVTYGVLHGVVVG